MEYLHTKSWLKGKRLVQVPLTRIRPTNTVNLDYQEVEFSPILLIKAADSYYYVADGNHRFFSALKFQKNHFIEVWVLEEGDQQKLHGNPLPTLLKEWKKGITNLTDLCNLAQEAYKKVGIEVIEDLKLHCERRHAMLSLTLATSVMTLIQDTSSLEIEAAKCGLSEEELASYQKCFIDGGIKAIKERLEKELRADDLA